MLCIKHRLKFLVFYEIDCNKFNLILDKQKNNVEKYSC